VGLFGKFLRQSGKGWWPIFILTLVILWIAARHRTGDAGTVSFFLAAAFLGWGLLGGLSHGSSWCLVFIIFLLAAALANRIRRSRAVLLVGLIASVMIAANSALIVEQIGILTGNIQYRPPRNREEILALQSTPQHPLLVDASVARYVFDYRLPPGFIDYEFSAPFPAFVATDTKMRPEDTYLLGPGRVLLLNGDIHTTYPLEYWSPFRGRGPSYFKNPCEAFVIPARDCVAFQEKLRAEKK
jgi:hypothetical protein